MLLLADVKKRSRLRGFLCTALKQTKHTEYQASAGTDRSGNPAYFCYELDMRQLLRVRQELGWNGQGSIFCFPYQRAVLETFLGKGARYREIVTEKVMEYLCQEED